MDYERWVTSRVDAMKTKIVAESSGLPVPKKILDKISKCDANEKNNKGETLVIAVVRYVPDELKQIKYLQLLFRAGADPNVGDSRHGKTPLMFACLEKKRAVCRVLSNHPSVDPKVADKLGNTALMYAAMNGDDEVVSVLTARLAKSWSFDVFRAKNMLGKTAENVAAQTGQVNCAHQLKNERIQMLQSMHKQLALVRRSGTIKGWSGYNQAYKWAKVWQHKSMNSRSNSSIPSHRLSSSQINLPKLTNDTNNNRSTGGMYRSKSDTYASCDSILSIVDL